MLRNILALTIIYSVAALAQIQDSVTTETKLYPDTIFIKPDSVITSDSLLIVAERDSIVPLYSSPLTETSFITSNKELLKLEYKYTGDYLRNFPFNFTKDLGFTGQPNETFLYGVGNNAVSYLMDGVSYNDRFSNSLNLNLIQSEDVDSIEIVPLPRGFLYGAYDNPVSVNFITKDFITTQPYTRIRFYQGANRDMMFDGSFNAVVMKRLIASFDIANRIYDGTYDNTDYSIWQGKIKLKYLLSNDVNIIASYNYNDYNAGYSGGVDVDSILSRGENIEDILYDFRAAPMVYPNGELKTLTHLPRLRVLATPTSWLKTDASMYYLYNEYEKISSWYRNYFINSKTFGISIRNDAYWNEFKVQAYIDYEKERINYDEYFIFNDNKYFKSNSSIDYDLITFSGNATVELFDSTLSTSVFGRLNSYSTKLFWPILRLSNISYNEYSIGFDLSYKPSKFGEFYFGYSVPYANYDINKSLIETSFKFNFDFLTAKLKYFRNSHKSAIFDFIYPTNTKDYGNVSGFGLDFSVEYLMFLLQSNSSLYKSMDNTYLFGVPEFQTQIGLYYTGKLFNDNLDLKTGFVFYYTGKNNVYTFENGLVEVPSSYKLDFTLVGEIQKTAIIYFLWQNLLGNNYYITPYYPMPSRSIRFGVAWEMFN